MGKLQRPNIQVLTAWVAVAGASASPPHLWHWLKAATRNSPQPPPLALLKVEPGSALEVSAQKWTSIFNKNFSVLLRDIWFSYPWDTFRIIEWYNPQSMHQTVRIWLDGWLWLRNRMGLVARHKLPMSTTTAWLLQDPNWLWPLWFIASLPRSSNQRQSVLQVTNSKSKD